MKQMNQAEIIEFANKFLDAWNSQEVEAVALTYSEDMAFRDPNTRGEVKGRDAMRRYLKKLFDNWRMTWALREAFPLRDVEGFAVLWHATFAKPGGGKIVECDGIDLVLMENGLIKRNDVYFDRAVLAPLL